MYSIKRMTKSQRMKALVMVLTVLALFGASVSTRASNPHAPITLQIIDVAGQARLTKGMIDNYVKEHSDKVSGIEIITDTSPNLPGRIKAQIDGGKIDTALVLTGYDGVASGIAQGNWADLSKYADKFPKLNENYQDAAKEYNDLAQGFAIAVVYTPSGPFIEYDPSQVDTPPTTIEEVREWVKANPNKFIYARPANSGPGRTWLMGLPYLLGDKDPKDPEKGWDKTWAFLKEIGENIEYYPSRTGDVIKEISEGTRAMMPITMGWDINPRALGQMPKDYGVSLLKETTFVADAQFVAVPKGLDKDRMDIVLDLIAWMLKPEQQAIAYDEGYFYPGPAVKGVTADMAPQKSQDVLKEFGRPEFDKWISDTKAVLPLDAKNLVIAFNKWDKEIGGSKIKAAPTAVPAPATAAATQAK